VFIFSPELAKVLAGEVSFKELKERVILKAEKVRQEYLGSVRGEINEARTKENNLRSRKIVRPDLAEERRISERMARLVEKLKDK
jgi:hypothetical protein